MLDTKTSYRPSMTVLLSSVWKKSTVSRFANCFSVYNQQLFDEFFVISVIIKLEVSVDR